MSRRSIVFTATLATLLSALGGLASAGFDEHFEDRTMRLDYDFTGGQGQAIYSLERVVGDGPWPGSRTRLIDDLELGELRFLVADAESGELLYSRGYATIYDEWLTTGEARTTHRVFHDSLRFPWPKHPVTVTVEERDADNRFAAVWSVTVDPASRFVNPATPEPRGRVHALQTSGPPRDKVDLLILGDGYTEAELENFHADAERLVESLFRWEPFKSRRSDFNVWAIDLPAAESGVSRPRAGEFHRSPLGASFNTFDSERYVLTLDNRTLRDVAAAAPYEFIEILVNEEQYGGGGIFNHHATASVGAAFSEYVFVHEFGHHFAALADEYYTSPVSYETGQADLPEPWEPNVTALHEPTQLKWGDLVAETTPLPTPWDKEAYDERSRAYQARRAELRQQGVAETVMDELFREVKSWSTELLASQDHAASVGAFEGARYEAHGLYRPEADCIMFTRDDVGFCRVCARAIERVIDLYARP